MPCAAAFWSADIRCNLDPCGGVCSGADVSLEIAGRCGSSQLQSILLTPPPPPFPPSSKYFYPKKKKKMKATSLFWSAVSELTCEKSVSEAGFSPGDESRISGGIPVAMHHRLLPFVFHQPPTIPLLHATHMSGHESRSVRP